MGRGWCFTLHSTSAVYTFAPRLIFFPHLGRFLFRTRASAPPPSLGHGRLLASSGAPLHSSMCVAAMQRARISQWPCPSSSCFHTVTPPSDAQSVNLCAGLSRLFQPYHCRLAPRPRVSHCARVLRDSAPVVAAWRGVYLLRRCVLCQRHRPWSCALTSLPWLLTRHGVGFGCQLSGRGLPSCVGRLFYMSMSFLSIVDFFFRLLSLSCRLGGACWPLLADRVPCALCSCLVLYSAFLFCVLRVLRSGLIFWHLSGVAD